MKTAINHKGYEMTRQEYLDFVKKTFEDMMELIRKKNTDYSQDADPFSNFRAAELYGVDPLVGLCIRMSDKMARIQSFCKSGNLQAESVDDAFRDLVGYSVLALGMLTEKEDKFLDGLDAKTLNMIDESVRNADAGKVGGTFNPNVPGPDEECFWWVKDPQGDHIVAEYLTYEDALREYGKMLIVKPDVTSVRKRVKVPEPDADEVYEWQWELDSGTDYWTTGLYFTEDEIQVQAAGIPHKRKLITTGRRRT